MEEKRSEEIRKEVAALLAARRLKDAMEVLSTDMESLQEWTLRTRFSQMKSSYEFLLDYLRKGTPDPERERMYGNLLGECHILNDQIAIARKPGYKARCIEEIAVLRNRLHENYANQEAAGLLSQAEGRKVKAELAEEHERLLDNIFTTITESIAWQKSDAELVSQIIKEKDVPVNDRAVIASAVTLSLMKCFEPLKAMTLIKAVESESTRISTRALVGYIIAIFTYGSRLEFHPELVAATESLIDSPRLLSRIATTQIQMLRCRETQKIDRKMREEIIPAMMKNPHLNGEKMGFDIISEIENEDKNPEWKEWTEKDRIKDKLEEITQWQIEGADVYMSTFSQLKNYPFFKRNMNWLRPFDPTLPAIADIMPQSENAKKTLLSTICSSPLFCNSDKYSFCLTLNQVPQGQKDMLMQQITGGDDTAEQGIDRNSEIPKEKKAEIEGNLYIQDLYRFFKLSPARKEFKDPFTLSLNLLESPTLRVLVNEPGTILRIFNHLMEKEYYAEAVNAGRIYEKENTPDEHFYQEMGYCLQKEKDYSAAIDYYTRADIIKPDTLWTISHIAQCYRLSDNADKAIGFYLLAEEIAPENISLLRQTGECLALLKRYDEAFARFFKMEFLKPGSISTLRAIAWCSFLTGKEEQARNYYRKVMEAKGAKFTDYMNAAHVEWITRNNAAAVELYIKAKKLCDNKELFFAQFEKDFDTLIERGADRQELLLLRDIIA